MERTKLHIFYKVLTITMEFVYCYERVYLIYLVYSIGVPYSITSHNPSIKISLVAVTSLGRLSKLQLWKCGEQREDIMTTRQLKPILAGLLVFVLILMSTHAYGTVWTYPAYGDSTYESPDYEITVQQGSGPEIGSFACYSYMKNAYEVYNMDGTLREIIHPDGRNDPTSHTSTIFSFDGNPVTVRIKVKQGASHISLPLTSAKVLPSSYNIPCTIENGNTIVFTMDRPEKVIVIPNYDMVWGEYESLGQGHRSISSWREYGAQKQRRDYHDVNDTEISEGFKNPVIIISP